VQFSTRGKLPRVKTAHSPTLRSHAAQELDDSVLDEITVEDLSQAGLNEQQGITFICKYREYLNLKIDGAPQIATASGSSSVSNSATAGTSDAHLSSTDARVVWRWVTRRSCCACVSLQLVIVFVQMAE
jgi:hypothetical protein